MIANASHVRIPCESPVPSRPVPSLFGSPIHDISPFAREGVGHSRPHVLTVMDGCYADEIRAAR